MAGNNTDEVEGSANTEVKIHSNTEIPPEFLIKHPLQNTWTLWFYDNDKSKTWEENLIQLTTFDTVEDFWRLYHHIKLPSELRHGHDYCIFKKGIRPMWEDDANKMGGRWLMCLDKKHRTQELDRCWLEVILLLIGENLGYPDDVNGAVANIRQRNDKIAIWTGDMSKQTEIMEIGRKLKGQLGLPGKVVYEVHRDTMAKNSSSAKYLYSV